MVWFSSVHVDEDNDDCQRDGVFQTRGLARPFLAKHDDDNVDDNDDDDDNSDDNDDGDENSDDDDDEGVIQTRGLAVPFLA